MMKIGQYSSILSNKHIFILDVEVQLSHSWAAWVMVRNSVLMVQTWRWLDNARFCILSDTIAFVPVCIVIEMIYSLISCEKKYTETSNSTK